MIIINDKKKNVFNPSKLQILCIVWKHKVLSALNKLTVLLSERKKWFLPWLVYVWNTGGCTEMCSTYFVCGISLAFCVWFCCMDWNEENKHIKKSDYSSYCCCFVCVFNSNTCMNYTARYGVKNQFSWPFWQKYMYQNTLHWFRNNRTAKTMVWAGL